MPVDWVDNEGKARIKLTSSDWENVCASIELWNVDTYIWLEKQEVEQKNDCDL